jgi:hypothetical protein
MGVVLNMLKESSTGLTQKQIVEKAKERNIDNPWSELANCVVDGLVRFDGKPKPGRFKATKKAFDV